MGSSFIHLQSILLAFNLVKASAKSTMLKYFWKGLKPSILAELENKDLKLENFLKIVKKVLVAKAKANLRSWATTKDIN